MAWIHSHNTVQKCALSSIDLHNQMVLEQQIPHILAIVVEVGSKGVMSLCHYWSLTFMKSSHRVQYQEHNQKPSFQPFFGPFSDHFWTNKFD